MTESIATQQVRFAIVGVGTIAEFHADAIARVPGAALVACTSRRPDRAAAFASRHHCDSEPDLQAMLARGDVDAVVIATPSGTHAAIGVAAAHAGKHVLCEKPLDVTLEAADRLIAACKAAGVRIGTIFQSRFGPGARAVKAAVDAGWFGRLAQCSVHVPWYRDLDYYASVDWRGTRAGDGGALFNQGVHAVDMLLWLAGDVAAASAVVQTRIHPIETEDNAAAWLRFACGAVGVIQSSTACFPGDTKRVEIRGERGSAVLADDVITTWAFDEPRELDSTLGARQRKVHVGGGAADPAAISVDGHVAQYRDFVEAVRFGREPAVSGREGRRSVELICALYESSRTGRIVHLA